MFFPDFALSLVDSICNLELVFLAESFKPLLLLLLKLLECFNVFALCGFSHAFCIVHCLAFNV